MESRSARQICLSATYTGKAVRGVGRFMNLGDAFTPGGLGRELDKIITPPKVYPFIPSNGWGWR